MAIVNRGGKPAVTHFLRRRKLGDWASLVEYRLKRGEPIKLGFIWPLSAIPLSAIRFMAVGQQKPTVNGADFCKG